MDFLIFQVIVGKSRRNIEKIGTPKIVGKVCVFVRATEAGFPPPG